MNRILLTYFSFVIACLVVIAAFITATTYTQLALGILLYPVLVFFAFKAFPRKIHSYSSEKPETPIQSALEPAEIVGAKNRDTVGISDIDKRAFLKLIGGAGITLFLFSIFNRRTEGLFSRSLPAEPSKVSLEDIAGKKIDPAQSQPTDGYRISEMDDDIITFYGFINKEGGWFIMRGDTDTGSFRYATGDSNFPANWTNRENLKYDYYSNVF